MRTSNLQFIETMKKIFLSKFNDQLIIDLCDQQLINFQHPTSLNMDKSKQSLYLIKSTVLDGQLFIDLNILDDKTGTKIIKCFGKSFTDQNLSQTVKKNFKDINNVHSILTENPAICKVDIYKGLLTLVYEVVFPNGSKFQLEGLIQLDEKDIPIQKGQSTNLGVFEQKISKMEQSIKKIQQSYESDSKLNKDIINKVIKDISEQIQELKERSEEMKNWKKLQQTRYKELLNDCQSRHQQSSKIKNSGSKISDQIMHSFNQKADENKQIFTDRLQKLAQKLQDIKDTTNRHQKYIEKTTQQNIELKKTVKTLEDKVAKLSQKSELFEEKFMELLQSHKKSIKVINSQHQELQNVKKQVTSPKKQQKGPVDPLLMFFESVQQSNGPNKKSTTSNFSMYNVQSPKAEKGEQKTLTIPQFIQIHPASGYSKQFINNGKVISYNGVSEQPTQLLGKNKVTSNKCTYFTVGKTKNNQIGIGIMDSKYSQDRNSIKKPNCIMYNASNGALYDGGAFISSDGTGFRQGDKVKMKVNTLEGVIQWSIGGISVCKHKSEKIKDNKLEWLPFIRMCDKGDAVKWTIQ